jgi:hypothetical protein
MQSNQEYPTYVPSRDEEIRSINAMIASLERSNADLLARYGDGVRPSWVSADMSMNGHRIQYYRKELAKLEAEDNA